MKNLVVLALVLVSATAMAKTHKVTAEAKKAAKEACLAENKDMKGKDLKSCVAEKVKASATTEAAKTEAAPAAATEPAKK
jgi:uncharacterized membrane protein